MQDAALVGMLQRLGQPGPQPGDRAGVGPPGQGRPGRRPRAVGVGLEPVQGRDQLGARARAGDGRIGQGPRQGEPAEIRHAEQMESPRRVGAIGVDRDDMRVLQSGQGLGLARAEAGDLDHDGSIGQSSLLGAEDAGERPAPQLIDEAEAGDGLARLGEDPRLGRFGRVGGGAGALGDEPVDLEDLAQPVGDPGEAGQVLGRVGGLARLLAQAILLVDQGHEGLVVDRGVALAIPGDVGRLPHLAAKGHVGAEEGQQGTGVLAGPAGEEVDRVGPGADGGAPGGLEAAGQADDLRRGGLVPGPSQEGRSHAVSPPVNPHPPHLRPGA